MVILHVSQNNSEKYISFSIGQLNFLDSFQFMASSLEKLEDATDKADLKITKSVFRDKADIILRKDIYPYEYIDSKERFDETELPPIDNFTAHFQTKISAQTGMFKRCGKNSAELLVIIMINI